MNAPIQTQTLLFQTSPYGNIDALVEHDGCTVYFYLNGDQHFGLRACWVRNTIQGPLVIDPQSLAGARPPVLPRLNTLHREPQPVPNPDHLNVLWFSEGNGAVLREQESVLAIIPPWSGMDGCHGYAAACSSPNPVCFPLPTGNDWQPLEAAIESSKRFWQAWSAPDLFLRWQEKLLAFYQGNWGNLTQYFSIDGGQFPPRGLGVFDNGSDLTFVTIGMALCPMPRLGNHRGPLPSEGHIELGFRMPKSDSNATLDVAKRMSSLAGYPWREWTWFANAHTVNWIGTGQRAQLWKDSHASDSMPEFPDSRISSTPPGLLWIHPI